MQFASEIEIFIVSNWISCMSFLSVCSNSKSDLIIERKLNEPQYVDQAFVFL